MNIGEYAVYTATPL